MKTRTAVLVLLFLLTAVDRGLFLYQELTRGDFGFRATLIQGQLLIRELPLSAPGEPDAPVVQAGIKPGDRLIAIFTLDGSGGEIHSFSDFGDYQRRIPPGEGCRVVIGRPQTDGSEDVLAYDLEPPAEVDMPVGELMINFGDQLYLPLLAALTGAFIGLAKPRDDLAFLAAMMFFAFAWIFGDPHTVLHPSPIREISLLIKTTARTTTSYLIMLFFLRFPVPSPLDRRVPWIKKVALIPVVLFLVFGIANDYSIYASFDAFQRVAAATKATGVRFLRAHLEAPLMLGMVGFGLVSLISNTMTATSSQERRRLQWLVFGTLVGLLPLIGLILLNYFDLPYPAWLFLVVAALVQIFPLSFIYVVLRHRVFGIRLIVRRGLRYALVSRGFIAVEGLIIFGLLHFLVTPLLIGSLGVSASVAPLGTALAALLLALGIRQINRRILPLIDSRFFRDAYDARRVLVDLGRAARRLVSRPDRLLRVVADQVLSSLHPSQVAVFLADERFSFRMAQNGDAEHPTFGQGLVPAYHETLPPGAETAFRLHLHRFEPKYRVAADLPEISESDTPPITSPFTERVADPDRAQTEVLSLAPEVFATRHARRLPIPESWLDLRREFDARLVIPLAAGGRLLGFIALGEKLSEEPYAREDRELLLAVAEQVSVALDYSSLVGKVAEQDALRREMAIAEEVQNQLFPQVLPEMSTLSYTGTCRPARGVGGDYFDFVKLDDHRLMIALADISGKGVSAALLMASLQGALRSHATADCEDLAALVEDLNRLMCASTEPGRFATLFCGVYDDRDRSLRYVNAGHLPPIVARPNGVPEAAEPAARVAAGTDIGDGSLTIATATEIHRLDPSGMVIGILPHSSYEARQLSLSAGDALVVFSDGLTEAESEAGTMFEDDRVVSLVRDNARLGEEALQSLLHAEVADFVGRAPQGDDITTIVAQVR